MKHTGVITILLLLVPLLLSAQKPGDFPRTMYVIFDDAPVYADADYLSEIRGKVRLGDSCVVVGMKQKYFIVEYQGSTGYLLGTNLDLKPPKRKGETRKKGKSDSNPTTQGSSLNAHQEKHPSPLDSTSSTQGTTTRTSTESHRPSKEKPDLPQCMATTKSGRQCSRRASDSTGYCWQHRARH